MEQLELQQIRTSRSILNISHYRTQIYAKVKFGSVFSFKLTRGSGCRCWSWWWRWWSRCFGSRFLSADSTWFNFKQWLTCFHCITVLHVNFFNYTRDRCRYTDCCFICFDFHDILISLHFVTNLARESVRIVFFLLSANTYQIYTILQTYLTSPSDTESANGGTLITSQSDEVQ